MSYTENDLNAFYQIPADIKAKILCGYLGMRGNNMTDVAVKILHDSSPQCSQRVSVVTRVYGFDGKNSGRFYRLYEPFKNEPGILKTMLSDFTAFVSRYPNGETDPATMESFLRERIRGRAKPQQQSPRQTQTYNPPPRQTYSQPQQQYTPPQQQYTPPSQTSSGGSGGYSDFDPEKLKTIGLRILVVIIIVAAVFAFGSKKKSGCVSLSCGSGTTCVPGKQVNALLDIGCYTDGTFDYVNIVVDDIYYSPLNIGVNKLQTELDKGKHTVYAEYKKNGAVYKTEALTFKVKKDGDLVDLLIFPDNEDGLVLTFSDNS